VRPRKKPSGGDPGPLRLRLPEGEDCLLVPRELPLLPLRDTVVFPSTTLPLFVGRSASVAAVESAASGERLLLALAQRSADVAEPTREDLYQVGTIVRVLQVFRLPDGTRRILAEGLGTARCLATRGADGHLCATLHAYPEGEAAGDGPGAPDERLAECVNQVRDAFQRYVETDRRVPREALLAIHGDVAPLDLAHRVSSHVRVPVSVRQRLLECGDPMRQLGLLQRVLASETERAAAQSPTGLDRERPGRRNAPAEPALGADCGGATAGEELAELAAAIEAAGMPSAAFDRARRELDRLARGSSFSPEATVSRNYLEWLLQLPWVKTTPDCSDLARAQRILDEDHYGLIKVKERILEQISVIKLAGEIRGPLLCLAGPPGVGKTSLARSIARALDRRFVRVSLGGVRDEAEIRGHRRTYVGSLPGRILQGMRRAGVINPVFLLDEIDKLGHDLRGDPAAALLEVLDPEQNSAFNDHYLEVDYDLSKVLFVTTANLLDAIPDPLRDRLEVIRIPGYLEAEKLRIASGYLVPRQVEANGLKQGDLMLPEETIARLIRGYTREAGVRNLEREIARVCRRVAKFKAGGEEPVLKKLAAGSRRKRRLGLALGPEHLPALLGVSRFTERLPQSNDRVGIVTGLAWTEAGGEVLTVECSVLAGRGRLLLTGKLGEIMRESAQAALSYIRSRAGSLGIDPNFYRNKDIHIHMPEGAIPKDGPSAGVTIATAVVSALTAVPTRPDVAMTGEVTLRGHVLAVGGLAEKIVAARRAGVSVLVLPRENEPHLLELSAEIIEGLTVHLVSTMDDVLAHALASPGAAVWHGDDAGSEAPYLNAA
jgi:ATP-dependent Lon protease